MAGDVEPCACTTDGKRGDYEFHTPEWCFDVEHMREMHKELCAAGTALLRITDLGCSAVDPHKRPCGLCAACVALEALGERA